MLRCDQWCYVTSSYSFDIFVRVFFISGFLGICKSVSWTKTNRCSGWCRFRRFGPYVSFSSTGSRNFGRTDGKHSRSAVMVNSSCVGSISDRFYSSQTWGIIKIVGPCCTTLLRDYIYGIKTKHFAFPDGRGNKGTGA